jgi:hypothetical protein
VSSNAAHGVRDTLLTRRSTGSNSTRVTCFELQPSASRTAPSYFASDPTDESVGYFHSSAAADSSRPYETGERNRKTASLTPISQHHSFGSGICLNDFRNSNNCIFSSSLSLVPYSWPELLLPDFVVSSSNPRSGSFSFT